MSTDLVRHEPAQQLTVLSNDQLSYIARTEFVPAGLRGNLPAIMAAVATGRALGLADMLALRSIHVIDGKTTFSAELMTMLVRRAGHSIVGEVTETGATVTGTRADNGDSMSYTFTVAMAERAGLANKQNWRRYPESMCWARAVSQVARMLFADCFAGATYVPEELEGDYTESGEPQALQDNGEHTPSSVSQAAATTAEPASPGGPASDVLGDTPATAADKRKPTKKQIDYLNMMVGPMEPADKRRVYATVGLMRVQTVDSLILELGGVDEAGVLHWSPLRDSLTRQEASSIIDRLEKHAAEKRAEPEQDAAYFSRRIPAEIQEQLS